MRRLVIGCGYVGQRVAARWSVAGDEVFVLTRSTARAEDFRRRGWNPLVGDVTQPETLREFPPVDTVLHAVGFDRAGGLSQREVYVEGLKNVLENLASRAGRMIYISSTSVYGQQRGEWIDETSPTEPTRSNGQICRDAERLLIEQVPGANVLRLAGIYGPGRLLRRVADLQAGKPVGGDPAGWLNLIHVEDAVETILACDQRGEPGGVYLVSDDYPIRRRDYYHLLAELVGVPAPVFADGEGSDFAEGQGKRCSNRKIREQLRVPLRYPTIREGLPDAVGRISG